MSVKILKVEIKNFRSIRQLSFDPGCLSVLVGMNDSGKSNILRALNLFFNEETNSDQKLNFTNDFNVDVSPKQRAKEIGVSILLSIPESYKHTNGDIVKWSKTWRKDGLHEELITGLRKKRKQRGSEYFIPVKISPKSNLRPLLSKIRYVYVPAIKDSHYFSRLRSQIYGIIAEVASTEFKSSSKEFESAIAEQTKALTEEISAEMGFNSRLAMPHDLSHIFERLDFLGEDNGISLDYRGDGIKARHIPMILKFMADRSHELPGRGMQPYSFIWGYEEPENNLEITNSIKMADQFWSFIGDGIDQILVTTHSPVFYGKRASDADRENGWDISCHYVSRGNAEEGTKASPDSDEADRELGVLHLLEPKISVIRERVEAEAAANLEATKAREDGKSVIYVEGPSDKKILERAIQIFSPNQSENIRVTCAQRGGFQFVVDRLNAWDNIRKHEKGLPKHVGLIDGDECAIDYMKNSNKNWQKRNNVACYSLAEFDPFDIGRHNIFNSKHFLERFYSDSIWESEKDVIELKASEYLSIEALNQIAVGASSLDKMLHKNWRKRATHSIVGKRKVPLADQIANLSDAEAKDAICHLSPVVEKLIGFLLS